MQLWYLFISLHDLTQVHPVCLLLPLHKTQWLLFPNRPFFFMTTKFSTLKGHHHVHKLRGQTILKQFMFNTNIYCQSQWPRCLRQRSKTARLLGLCVRIPPGASMSVCRECCVLSGIGLCDGLITHPKEYYRLWCVIVCDLETSRMRKPMARVGPQCHRQK